MTVKVLCVGDPHIQVTNLPEVDIFMEKLINLATEQQPDIIVILGDTLHTHERLHTLALNKAYELINNMRLISKTYVLVGNHDIINNSQFLMENHWLTSMKEWNNTVIVDSVVVDTINEQKFVFTPYVPPGRFIEALNTIGDEWKTADCIFAHQEFAGCKMGAIISVEGDNWDVKYPHVISGHIHSRQTPQKNVYYPGSAMQNAFGESEKNIIPIVTFQKSLPHKLEEVDLLLARKKIVYMDVDDVDTYNVPETEDKIKVTLSGSYEEFKALKKTKKYKNLIDKGIKVVFKPKKLKKVTESSSNDVTETSGDSVIPSETNTEATDFKVILGSMITELKDPYLLQAYELVVNGSQIAVDDVLFL